MRPSEQIYFQARIIYQETDALIAEIERMNGALWKVRENKNE